MRDEVAKRIPQQNASLNWAAVKEMLNRATEKMTADSLKLFGFGHSTKFVTRQEQPTEALSLVHSVIAFLARMRGKVRMDGVTGALRQMKDKMYRHALNMDPFIVSECSGPHSGVHHVQDRKLDRMARGS